MRSTSEPQLLDRTPPACKEWNGRRPTKLLAECNKRPIIGDRLLALGAALMDAMDHRTRELVALRVSAVRNNEYVWNGHVVLGLQLGALDRDEVARVAVGPTVFSGRDAYVLWAVDHVLANRPLDPATGSALDARDLLAIKIATGFYATVAGVMRGFEPEPDVPGVTGIESPARARGTYADRAA